jgi:hypothetical protein
MDKVSLLDELDRATDKAADIAIRTGFPIPVSNKSTMIGNMIVEKNAVGLYNVLNSKRVPLHTNISVFEVAVNVAQRYNSRETGLIKQILYLDERFSKFHTDMVHYLHCLKGAKKRHDIDRMVILEDKFQVAEQSAKSIRDKLTSFKVVK